MRTEYKRDMNHNYLIAVSYTHLDVYKRQAKKSEQMIMSLMPVGIILYLQMTSPGFLSVLYGNPFGIAAMSICLVIYAAAYWLGRRIVDIEV